MSDSEGRQVHGEVGSVESFGSCNGCSSRVQYLGFGNVLQLNFKCTQVRICRDCAHELKEIISLYLKG